VSFSNFPSVQKYIVDQEEHHRIQTFEEEYIAFLDRHEIKYERRLLFEKEFAG
jgi:putative transposase